MTEYCLSKYNIEVSQDNYHLIFNQVTTACVVLDADHYSSLCCGSLDETTERNLIQLGIIVPLSKNETKDYLLYVQEKNIMDENILFYRILTTTACNAKCPYCYEKDMPNMTMSKEIALNIINYLKKESKNKRKVIIQWFGGEPLIRFDIISYICAIVKEHCKEQGIIFESQIITNGYLLGCEPILKELEQWTLKYVQISLDGTFKEYEKIKQFGNKNSFFVVIDNVKHLAQMGIQISIRLNYDSNNILDIYRLIDFLAEEFKDFNNVKVYGNHLFDSNLSNNHRDYIKLENNLFDKLFNAGLIKNIFSTLPIRTGCFAGKNCGGTIMPNGDLFYCSLAATNPNFKIGNVNFALEFNRDISWTYSELPNECLACKILPLCCGGCLFERKSGMTYCLENEKHIEHKLWVALKSCIQTT